MSQTRSADAARARASAAERTSGAAPAPRNPWVAWLIAVAALPVVLALALVGLRVSNAAHSAGAYGRVAQLATVDQQVTGLARAMADERTSAAAFISGGRTAADLAALQRQYAVTDAQAAKVRRLISQLGHGYPAQTRADVAQVLASMDKLPGLRGQTAQSQASAQAAITGYSSAAAGLFPVNNGIADQSGNATLIYSARALGSLSRLIDDASQQQAILGVALAEGHIGPGALTALTTARGWQASDLGSFRNSATAPESWALTQTLARPPARQAQKVERRAIAAGNGALVLGPQASQQWSSGMSYTVGWMGQAEQQLAGWIPADAKALQRSAMRSAVITGAVAAVALLLVLQGLVFAARSRARRRRKPEAPALERAGAPLPISVSAVAADHETARPGEETARPGEPLALVDVLGAASSEVEDGRVILDVQEGVYLSGSAATDTVHLLAELLDNATAFSPETTQVIVSGHAVYGGGSLVTITDGGTGMAEEELTQLNWQLANPTLADVTATPHMGLFTVAHLAARHGITVTLTMPPDGGTTAEVYLPDALISLDAEPDGWRLADEAPLAGAYQEAGPPEKAKPTKEVSPELAHLLFPARRFASGPERPLGSENGTRGSENGARETVPVLLGAPLPLPAPGTSTGIAELEPADAAPGDESPIFESVRSGYSQLFGRDPLLSSEQQPDESPAGQPARPPAPWGNGNGHSNGNGNGNGRAVARPPAAGRPAFSGLPQSLPPSGPVRGTTVGQKTRQGSATE